MAVASLSGDWIGKTNARSIVVDLNLESDGALSARADLALDVLQKHHLRRVGVDQTVDVGAAGISGIEKPTLGILDLSHCRSRHVASENCEVHAGSPGIELT